jgi:L-ascorbate metabolism protein UlaG (beta-lactamase superfamily)
MNRLARCCTLVQIAFLALVSGCASSLSPAPAIAKPGADAAPVALSGSVARCSRISVTRVAHASVLLDFDGQYVLTDPWFSEKAAYHHGEPLGIPLAKLPHLAAVVASHAHYDHFDLETFRAYPDKTVPFFVGPEMVQKAKEAGFVNVRELVPWESAAVGELRITAAPGAHGVDEITFVLEGAGQTVYFGGDTRFIPQLREIHARFPSIQLALLPVNGLKVMPIIRKQVVMNPEEAAELAGILGAEVAVPTHYAFQGSWFTETFILTRDGDPARFVAAARTRAPHTQARVLAPGERLVLERCPTAS